MISLLVETNVNKFIFYDARIDHVNKIEQTTLHIIVNEVKSRIARYLLIRDIDVFIKNCYEYTTKFYVMIENKSLIQKFVR